MIQLQFGPVTHCTTWSVSDCGTPLEYATTIAVSTVYRLTEHRRSEEPSPRRLWEPFPISQAASSGRVCSGAGAHRER